MAGRVPENRPDLRFLPGPPPWTRRSRRASPVGCLPRVLNSTAAYFAVSITLTAVRSISSTVSQDASRPRQAQPGRPDAATLLAVAVGRWSSLEWRLGRLAASISARTLRRNGASRTRTGDLLECTAAHDGLPGVIEGRPECCSGQQRLGDTGHVSALTAFQAQGEAALRHSAARYGRTVIAIRANAAVGDSCPGRDPSVRLDGRAPSVRSPARPG